MLYFIKVIVTALITALMSSGMVNLATTEPQEAAADFMDALKSQKSQEMEKYIDNEYINFLCNSQGDEKMIGRIQTAVFKNFSYEVTDVKQKNDVAVAKVTVKNSDLSSVQDDYDEAAYEYIMENLYSEDIEDKEKLADKCLELYVTELEEAAGEEADFEETVYVPMVDNGYHGWNIIMSDELIQPIMGNIEIPAE